jgi:hypothetical protein
MDSLLEILSVRNVVVGYLAIGAVVCFVHPLLRHQLRQSFEDLTDFDLRFAAIFLKPLLGFLVLLLYCVLWPIAWLRAGKSEEKTRQVTDAQLEKLRPFAQIYSAMNAPVRYTGNARTRGRFQRVVEFQQIAAQLSLTRFLAPLV